ncbi:hypothetical protein [Oceaniglobus roseus]|uniref:hypothetical protein n=1 Tax=Oceaniglobus roseus TaxID=1737570 RepID=UPI000C7ECD95|nr:hypothetical protein [Kandeliimicrobium roseum]
MSELDPIRPPESRRFARSVIIGAAVVLGLIASLSWWDGGAWWRFVVAALVSGAVGAANARAFLKKRT